jgi:uncharacterized membrane protein
MSIAIVLHILFVVIWVGGMFFAYMFLRPVAGTLLEPPIRLQVWSQIFKRFFVWIWIAVILIPVSGHAMIMMTGGMANVGTHVHIMMVSGYLMIAIFLHVFFAPYKRLKRAVSESNWQEAGRNLNQIRLIVGFNLLLGLFTITVAAGGRYML